MVPSGGNEEKRSEGEEAGEQSPSAPIELERDVNQTVITSFFKNLAARAKAQGESCTVKVQVAKVE